MLSEGTHLRASKSLRLAGRWGRMAFVWARHTFTQGRNREVGNPFAKGQIRSRLAIEADGLS